MKHLAAWKTQGQDIQAIKDEKVKATGVYYRLMSEHVKKVLADPKRVCPAYDEKAGYEIAGFAWFQGWNDMCDTTTYPKHHEPGGYAEYTTLMAHFIRDVRKELSAPDMRFVIAVIGVDGDKATGGIANLRPAMAAPAEMPEFKGNVFAVETAPFWDHAMSALMPKKELVDFRLGSAYVLDKEGVKEARDPGTAGWEPIGAPGPEDRVWRFTSFDPQNEKDQLPKTEKRRFRNVALTEGLAQWQSPEFDDSKWNRGRAPIGLGVWRHHFLGNTAVKYEGRVTEPHAAIDLFIEGITVAGRKIVDSVEYKARQMDKVCTREEQRIMAGASNGGYHYLGSAKILGQIGKALADAMPETNKK